MGVRITDRMTSDGKRFEKMLKELGDLEVRIGFQKGEATEADGTDIADIAMWNELGTSHSPSRPFIRMSVDENKAKIDNELKEVERMSLNGASAEQILKRLGLFQKDLMQEKIKNGSYVPNADSTVRKKGSSKPLIDTGRMRQSVNYVIKKKGSGD